MKFATLLVFMVLGSFTNRVRGGFFKAYDIDWVPGAATAGIALALGAWWVSGMVWAAIAFGGGYVLGECFGWTKWINFIPGNKTQAEYMAHKFGYKDTTGLKASDLWHGIPARLITNEVTDYKKYVFWGMVSRGLLWWVPPFAVAAGFGLTHWVTAVLAVAILSLMFPITYKFAFGLDLFGWRYLQKAETLYGLVYGLVIGIALIWG